MSQRTVSVEVCYIDVDVPLSNISTEELRAELAERDKGATSPVPPLSSEDANPIHEIYYAFKFGLTERAMELSRAYVCDELGVIL